MQDVLQLVPLAQSKPPGHGDAGPGAHEPEPVHVPAAVSELPEHDAAPQGVPAEVCSHVPPAAQWPSLPQGGLGAHWPAGAGMPASTLAHVPFGWPVSAIEHAWHVAVQALAQQKPLTQLPLVHWLPPEQPLPFASRTVQMPALQ
jgi:hypothetical protein